MMQNHDLQALFAEPIFRADISNSISAKQVTFIKNLKMNRNQTNLISDNLYIFDAPELASVKAAIQDALDYYGREVMGITQRLELTQSWSLINEPGVGMHSHSHSNSVVSGSFYFHEMPEPSAKMVFERHSTYQQLQLMPEAEKRNLYNTQINVVEPKGGEVVLFSSRLQHFVESNTSALPRYSIAFNSFVKGKLGSYRDVSELSLV